MEKDEAFSLAKRLFRKSSTLADLSAALLDAQIPYSEELVNDLEPFRKRSKAGNIAFIAYEGFLDVERAAAPAGYSARSQREANSGEFQGANFYSSTHEFYQNAFNQVMEEMERLSKRAGDGRIWWANSFWAWSDREGLWERQSEEDAKLEIYELMRSRGIFMRTSQTQDLLQAVKGALRPGVINEESMRKANDNRIDGLNFEEYRQGGSGIVKGRAAGKDKLIQIDSSGDYEIKDRTPSLFFVSGLRYVPDTSSTEIPSKFRSLLEASLPDEEDQIRLCEALAYAVFSDRPKIVIFLHGEGGAGKSTFINILTKSLYAGAQAYTSTSFSDLGRSFETSSLLGVSILLLPDVEYMKSMTADSRKSWAIIRQITGGDPVRIEQKYKQKFEAQLSCIPVITTNQHALPLAETSEAWGAISRRAVPIKFPGRVISSNRLPEETIEEYIAEEGPQILGYFLYLYTNLLKKSRGVIQAEHFLVTDSASEILRATAARIPETRETIATGNLTFPGIVDAIIDIDQKKEINQSALGDVLREDFGMNQREVSVFYEWMRGRYGDQIRSYMGSIKKNGKTVRVRKFKGMGLREKNGS